MQTEKLYKISVSKSKEFVSCKKKFHFNYVLKLKPKSFTFFSFGKLLHKALEDFHLALLENENLVLHELMSKCYKVATKQHSDNLTKEELDNAKDILGQYLIDWSENKNRPQVLAVEKNFKVDIENTTTLVGMIDRVQIDDDGVIHLLDYKTSKNMEYYEDDFFQMLTYAYIMLLEDPSLKKIRCSYMFLRHGFKYITKEFEPEEILTMKDTYVNYATEMQNEKEFAPNPSYLCNFCGFLAKCEEGKEKVRPKPSKNGATDWT